MPPYFLYLLGFQLLILVHTSQSSETAPEKADIQKLAHKLISETLAGQLADEVIKSEKPAKHPQHHRFIKDKNYESYDKSTVDINRKADKKVMHHKKEKPYRTTKNFLKKPATLLEESLQERRCVVSLEAPPQNLKDSNEMSDEGMPVLEDTKLNDKQIAKNNLHNLQQKDTESNYKSIAEDKHHNLHKHKEKHTKINDNKSSDDMKHPYKDHQEHIKLNDKKMHEKKRQHLYKYQQKRTKLTHNQKTDAKLHRLYKHKQKLNDKQVAGSRHHHLYKHQQVHSKKDKKTTDDNQQEYQQKNTKLNDKKNPDDIQQYHPYNHPYSHDYKKFHNSHRLLGLRNKTKVIHTLFLTTRNSKSNTTILPKVTPTSVLRKDTSASARKTPTYPKYERIKHGRIVSSSISQEFTDNESKSDGTIANSLNRFKTQLDEIVSKIGLKSKSDVSTSTAKTAKPIEGTRPTAPSSTTQSDLFTKF